MHPKSQISRNRNYNQTVLKINSKTWNIIGSCESSLTNKTDNKKKCAFSNIEWSVQFFMSLRTNMALLQSLADNFLLTFSPISIIFPKAFFELIVCFWASRFFNHHLMSNHCLCSEDPLCKFSGRDAKITDWLTISLFFCHIRKNIAKIGCMKCITMAEDRAYWQATISLVCGVEVEGVSSIGDQENTKIVVTSHWLWNSVSVQ